MVLKKLRKGFYSLASRFAEAKNFRAQQGCRPLETSIERKRDKGTEGGTRTLQEHRGKVSPPTRAYVSTVKRRGSGRRPCSVLGLAVSIKRC